MTIKPTLYERLQALLMDKIDGREYFSGSIHLEDEEADYSFTSSLIILYDDVHYPEGVAIEIKQITPVWWEFHSVTDDGEVLNDFDFNILRSNICS